MVDRQRFSNFDSDGDIAGAAILSNLALMPLSLVALWVGIESSNSKTLLCVIVGRSNDSAPCLRVVIVEWPVGESGPSAATSFFG